MKDGDYTRVFLSGKEFVVEGTVGTHKHKIVSIRTTHKEHNIKNR